MKTFRRLISLIMMIVLCVTAAGTFSACSGSDQADTYSVYYTNSSHDDIQSMDYTLSDSGKDDLYTMVTELFDQMFYKDYTADQLFSSKPDGVDIRSYNIDDDGILTVDFEGAYLDMTNVEEIILRSSVVLTVIQVNGVKGIRFTVLNNPITYSDGSEIGTMTDDDFVNILLTETGMLRQETDVTLYFANEEGNSLVPVIYHFVTSNNNTSIEEFIISQLIAGPSVESGTYPTISSNVELISVVSSDDICYVNFGENFLDQEPQPVSDEIMIYSIVNSLCRLTYINRVQILVNGEPADKLHTLTDISAPFSRNRSYEAN